LKDGIGKGVRGIGKGVRNREKVSGTDNQKSRVGKGAAFG
jgi:hypothetical protein